MDHQLFDCYRAQYLNFGLEDIHYLATIQDRNFHEGLLATLSEEKPDSQLIAFLAGIGAKAREQTMELLYRHYRNPLSRNMSPQDLKDSYRETLLSIMRDSGLEPNYGLHIHSLSNAGL